MSYSEVVTIRSGRHCNHGPPFVVEFVGTPGAGKTTLALRLVSLLDRQAVPAMAMIDAARPHVARTRVGRVINLVPSASARRALLWWAFYTLGLAHAVAFAREHRSLTHLVLRSQLRRPLPLRRRLHILFWHFQLCGRYRFLTTTADTGEVLVIDDGFLHRAVTLHASHCEQPDSAAIARYLDLAPGPDVIVLTIADRDVCETRICERGIWRHSRKLTHPELARLVGNCELAADLAVSHARHRDWVVVGVENSRREFARVEADLARVIAHCIAGSREMPASDTRHAR
jgi:hypothetical protein